jgi:Protein of unknown function (DUF2938)
MEADDDEEAVYGSADHRDSARTRGGHQARRRAKLEGRAKLNFIWLSVIVGIGGMVAMDLWAVLLAAVFGVPLPNWGLVGRWFAHLAKGTFFHSDIAEAQAVPNESAIGWLAHYAIGIVYAGVLIFFAGPAWVANPTFLPAWILGLVTVGAGWFILQPGMGAGWAASLRPNPMRIRALNLIAHTVFAAGLFATALLTARLS